MSEENKKSTKKPFKMPHTFVILLAIICLAMVVSWIIPSGEYAREVNDAGIKVVIPDQFSFVEKTYLKPWDIPSMIVKGFSDQATLIFMTMFVGAGFNVLLKTNAVQALIAVMIRKLGKLESAFIAALMLVCALIATTQSVTVFIAFTPVIIMMVRAMGYDSLVGAAIPLMGGAIGFSTGTLNASSTAIAQAIAELPTFSGIGYRFVCLFVYWAVSSYMLIRYAKKVKATPSLSPMYDLDLADTATEVDESVMTKMTVRQVLCLLSLVGTLVAICWGCIQLGWGQKEIGIAFIWLAIICGVCAGFGPTQICNYFVEGAQKLLATAFIVGISKTIANVFTSAQVMDTIVYGISNVLNAFPVALKGVSMFWANLIINFPIVSASGQAGVVMPIFTPVADMIGITRQTAVLAYNFGDGFCNYIIPWSSALMGNLAVANIPYDRWMKFFWKMFLVWIALGSVLLFIAQMMNYGPF